MALVATCPTLAEEDGARADRSLTGLLALSRPLQVRGSSKAVMVGATGFEPVTFSVSGRRSPAELSARVRERCYTVVA